MSHHFPIEYKLNIVKKALARREDQTLTAIAKQHTVSRSALSRWIQEVKAGKLTSEKQIPEQCPSDWSNEAKQIALTASEGLSEEHRSAYCREKGIYQHHLEQWKQELMNKPNDDKLKQYRADIRVLKDENKQLQRELRRKEKALAEAAALIILKKKAQALFNLDGED
jgi:hypothetical protein